MMTSNTFATRYDFINAAVEVLHQLEDHEAMKRVELYVHPGVFHADDVLCGAILNLITGENLSIIRRRMNEDEVQALAGATDGVIRIICDTGNTDYASGTLLALDHHSAIKDTYENGIQYAAIGKLFECLRVAFPDQFPAWDKVLTGILWPVESQDNGQKMDELEVQAGPNLFAWVNSFNCNWNEDSSAADNKYLEAVAVASTILDRQLSRIKAGWEGEQEASKAIENASDSIVVFDRFCPWQNPVVNYNVEHPESIIKVVVFKNMQGQWNTQCTPVAPNSFDTIRKIPEAWAGKRNAELAELSGINGAVFCHPGRWMAVWETKEEAIKAAKIIIG
jgi:uncharacterized UPF0160 family protein